MTPDRVLAFVAQILYLIILPAVLIRAWRQPTHANLNVALLFGVAAIAIVLGWLSAGPLLSLGRPAIVLRTTLVLSLAYLLLRLAGDFSAVPRWLMRASELGLALCVLALIVYPPRMPSWATLAITIYFCALALYGALSFVRAARRASGVTRRRLQAVALGSALLGLAILAAGVISLTTAAWNWTLSLVQLGVLLSGVCYWLGFVPPTWLRRAWQEPELRAFLLRAAHLPRLPTTADVVAELERGAAASLGATGAAVGLWIESRGVLRFFLDQGGLRGPKNQHQLDLLEAVGFTSDGSVLEMPADRGVAGRVFGTQRPLVSVNAARDDPASAPFYEAWEIQSVLAAPITSGHIRLGVLAVSSSRAPVFADSDLELVQLLADQAAVILECRALIDETAQVQAREEATRLKEDFLSAAAHDLRTPLTTILAQAQLLARRAARDDHGATYGPGVERIAGEAQRLARLVRELLDAQRAEHGQLVGDREAADLVTLVRAVCDRRRSANHRHTLTVDEPLLGSYDAFRLDQLVENLLDNAEKYSPVGGEIDVRLWREGDQARLTVSDPGIGIPAEDLLHVFQRFHRGRNVDDRQFAGLGLGLYVCRSIVEGHGGRIWAESAGPGKGTTIHVLLPLVAAAAPAAESLAT